MIGFIGTSLQLQSIITAHNQWLSKTRSIPYWTTSVLSSAVTDFVLIYESVTSSASVVGWLTLHSWTFNYPYEWIIELSAECIIDLSDDSVHEWTLFYNLGRTD
jgi:hypothetical protein